jgi:outer membrane protein OmpA-like peptidoglycan-associated protein
MFADCFVLRGLILSSLLGIFQLIAPHCLAQKNNNALPQPPQPPMQPADCPKFTAFPQLAMSVVVGCQKNDSTEVTLPLKPGADGRAREKTIRGEYEFREYHIQTFSQEQAFDNLMQLIPIAGFVVKYSSRPSTVTASNDDLWILINVSGDSYNISVVRGSSQSCQPISDPDEISRRMQAKNRIAIYGIQFTPENHINLDADSDSLEAVLQYMKKNPATHFVVESHKFSTNKTDDDDFEITRERANAVVDWLAAHGIPAENLQVKPFGRMRPVGDNDTLSEIQCNDRIELVKLINE